MRGDWRRGIARKTNKNRRRPSARRKEGEKDPELYLIEKLIEGSWPTAHGPDVVGGVLGDAIANDAVGKVNAPPEAGADGVRR